MNYKLNKQTVLFYFVKICWTPPVFLASKSVLWTLFRSEEQHVCSMFVHIYGRYSTNKHFRMFLNIVNIHHFESEFLSQNYIVQL